MTKCMNCDAEVSETDRFCRSCGKEIARREASSPIETESVVYESPGMIPREILAPGENLSFETRPVLWLFLVGPAMWAIIGIVIAIAAQFIPKDVPSAVITAITWLGVAIIIVALISIALRILRWRYTAYAATNRRIICQKGIIGKSYVDCPLQKVQTVYVQIPVLGRIFGFGTVRFATAGAAWIEIHWENVKEPRRVQRMLSEIMDAYRREAA